MVGAEELAEVEGGDDAGEDKVGELAVVEEIREAQFRDGGGGLCEEIEEALGGECRL